MPIVTQVAKRIFESAIEKIWSSLKQRDILANEEGEEAMFSSFAFEEFITRFARCRLNLTNPETADTSKELGKLKINSLYFVKRHCYSYLCL